MCVRQFRSWVVKSKWRAACWVWGRLCLCRSDENSDVPMYILLLCPSAFTQSLWNTAESTQHWDPKYVHFVSSLRSRKDSLESESSAAIIPHELIRTRQLESVHLKFNQESGALIPLCLRWAKLSSSSACANMLLLPCSVVSPYRHACNGSLKARAEIFCQNTLETDDSLYVCSSE